MWFPLVIGRGEFLEKLEDMDPRFEELGFGDRYGAHERYLHMMAFYEGIISPDLLSKERW
jgi:hypothetical protein